VYSILGYNTYFSLKKHNQNEGIIIFVKKDLLVSIHEYDFDECNILRLTVPIENKQIVYYCINSIQITF